MVSTKMKKLKERKIVKIELGNSFWLGISFAGGVFGFGWIPFFIVSLADAIIMKGKWLSK